MNLDPEPSMPDSDAKIIANEMAYMVYYIRARYYVALRNTIAASSLAKTSSFVKRNDIPEQNLVENAPRIKTLIPVTR